ncbi:hypothetical protein Tco_0582170, partial [Tanacetum coccineum]
MTADLKFFRSTFDNTEFIINWSKRVHCQLEQKDLLLKNGQLQHHDVLKKIVNPKMMGNDFPMVHL